eukprot:Skav213344  [mRNA]  locus=scaffold3340:533958:536657:+ [translate_table: standard]
MTGVPHRRQISQPEGLGVQEHIVRSAKPGQLRAFFSPVQAMSSLSALANLRHRDLGAASVFTSILCGMPEVHWRWARPDRWDFWRAARSPQCWTRDSSGALGCPFDVTACRRVMDALDSPRCVEILQSLSALELKSRLTVHLTAMLCGLLAPQLHDLRAREVLVVARAFSPDRIPDALWSTNLPGVATVTVESAGRTWRERALDLCFQSLRRHEHFLDSSYFTLLPFKLLCHLLLFESSVLRAIPLVNIRSPKAVDLAAPGLVNKIDLHSTSVR